MSLTAWLPVWDPLARLAGLEELERIVSERPSGIMVDELKFCSLWTCKGVASKRDHEDCPDA